MPLLTCWLAFARSLLASFNCLSRIVSANFGNIFIFLWRVAADTDRAHDLSIDDDRDSTLQSHRTRQGQRRHASILYLVFEHFAGPAKDRRSSRFGDADIKIGRAHV